MFNKKDTVRLRQMLNSAKGALSFSDDMSRLDLNTDRKLVLSLVKCIEIVGEAATKVTKETREQHSGIPWGEIITMRHRLIHAYFDIDLGCIWDTTTEDLPPLVMQLSKILEYNNPR